MKKNMRVLAPIIFGVLFAISTQVSISQENIYSDIKKFNSVLQHTYRNYVEPVESSALVEEAIRGMLEKLDVHSVYISKEQMKKVNEDFSGSFEGIGIQYGVVRDTLIVVSPIVGGASEALGILSNDKIVKIDGISVVGIKDEDVPLKLKGPKGSKVTLEIMRDNNPQLLKFEITRAEIPIYSIDTKFMIDGTDIGVVEVNRFSRTTHAELLEALNFLKSKGMRKIILDLRYNTGGFLDQAYGMADEFVGADTIVYTIGRLADANEVYIGEKGQAFEKMPLIVLVNEGSASASEIVSGAIQDLDRGLIIGETSYGKGLVQRQFSLDDGSAVRLTVAKYYTPSGRCIQRPFEDKEKYRNMAGRLELEEGSYIDGAWDKIKNQVNRLNQGKKENERINLDSLPIHHTRKGRIVFGGGGITPDVIIKPDTLTDFSVGIRRKNLFFRFINDYIASAEGMALRSKYKDDFASFSRNYTPDDKIMADFRKYAESDEIVWNDKEYSIDEQYSRTVIKMYIAQSLWNREKMEQVSYSIDKQLLRAVELFPEAEKLAQLR